MAGRTFATEGEILLDGEPLPGNDAALRRVYSMAETNYFPENMCVYDVFNTLKMIYPEFDRDRADELCGKFCINEFRKNSELSTGLSTALKLTAGLASGAPVLLLDEPTLGLDANSRDLFYRELLAEYERKPKLIVLSTHLIEEAENLMERAVIFRSGRVLLDESVERLLAGAYSVTGPAAAADAYAGGKDAVGEDALGGLKTVYLRGVPDRKRLPPGLELGPVTLQKLFVELTDQ